MNMTMNERQEAKARDQFLGCSRPPLPATGPSLPRKLCKLVPKEGTLIC